jgi:hypothetical protein
MGMADPLPQTGRLTLRFVRSNDEQLTCFLCGRVTVSLSVFPLVLRGGEQGEKSQGWTFEVP